VKGNGCDTTGLIQFCIAPFNNHVRAMRETLLSRFVRKCEALLLMSGPRCSCER